MNPRSTDYNVDALTTAPSRRFKKVIACYVVLAFIDFTIPLVSHGFNLISFSLLVVGLNGSFLFTTSEKVLMS